MVDFDADDPTSWEFGLGRLPVYWLGWEGLVGVVRLALFCTFEKRTTMLSTGVDLPLWMFTVASGCGCCCCCFVAVRGVLPSVMADCWLSFVAVARCFNPLLLAWETSRWFVFNFCMRTRRASWHCSSCCRRRYSASMAGVNSDSSNRLYVLLVSPLVMFIFFAAAVDSDFTVFASKDIRGSCWFILLKESHVLVEVLLLLILSRFFFRRERERGGERKKESKRVIVQNRARDREKEKENERNKMYTTSKQQRWRGSI